MKSKRCVTLSYFFMATSFRFFCSFMRTWLILSRRSLRCRNSRLRRYKKSWTTQIPGCTKWNLNTTHKWTIMWVALIYLPLMAVSTVYLGLIDFHFLINYTVISWEYFFPSITYNLSFKLCVSPSEHSMDKYNNSALTTPYPSKSSSMFCLILLD